MFFKQGIRSITMDDIAESLGMSKRTLYESFKNKEDLLQACIGWQYEHNVKARDAIEQEHGEDPLEIIRLHFRHSVLTLSNMHPNFINDLQKYHSRIWHEHAKSKQQENILYTQSLIKKCIEKGIFRQDTNSEILSVMIHSALPLMISGNVFPETRFALSEVFKQVMLNFIRGMATDSGLAQIEERFN